MAYDIHKFFETASPTSDKEGYDSGKTDLLTPEQLVELARAGGYCVMRSVLPVFLQNKDRYAADMLAQVQSARYDTDTEIFVAMLNVVNRRDGNIETMQLPSYFGLDGILLGTIFEREGLAPDRIVSVPGLGQMNEIGYALAAPEQL